MTLDPEQKIRAVTLLACYRTPTQVARALKKEFQLKEAPSLQALAVYDPTTRAGRELCEKLQKLFHETRADYLERMKSIPIAQQARRLEYLQELLDDETFSMSPDIVMSVLERAAKETGGLYTNVRQVRLLEKIAQEVGQMSDAELLALTGGTDPEADGAGGGEA